MTAQQKPTSNRVIMLMLDTLMDAPLQHAIEEEDVPALRFFMKHGNYYPHIVSPFPTMSVNVESTLLTGHYSDQHGIPALAWYQAPKKRIINYGTHMIELMKLGLSRSLYDSLYRLNNEHLRKSVTTIHEELQDRGYDTASINPLIHRGNERQQLKIPGLIRFFVTISKRIDTASANKFVYGRLAQLSPLKKYSSLWNKYGFNNEFAIQEFTYLLESNQVPHFSFVYLPDHDKNVHKRGPTDRKGIIDMDKQIQLLLNKFPSWKEAIQSYYWIIIGDNGQSFVMHEQKEALVDLRLLLQPFKIVKLRKGVKTTDQIVLANNLRSSLIYSLDTDNVPLTAIVDKLQQDDRIDMIAWKKEEYIHVTSGANTHSFQFKQGGELTDEYDQQWTTSGDPTILDLTVKNHKIVFGHYPDALKRLYTTLHSHSGDFVVTSVKPGHEFIGESTPSHPGGSSHGGFHKDDSLIPMLVTGTDTQPDFFRMVDLKKWIISLVDPDSTN